MLLTKKTAGSKKTKPTVIKGLSGKKVLKAVGAELTKFRPDLKVRVARPWLGWLETCDVAYALSDLLRRSSPPPQDAGVRRAAAVQKSLRVKKALSKKGPAGSAMVVV